MQTEFTLSNRQWNPGRLDEVNLSPKERAMIGLECRQNPDITSEMLRQYIRDEFGRKKSERSCRKYIADTKKQIEREREEAKSQGRDHLIDDSIDWNRLDILSSYGCTSDSLYVIREVHAFLQSSLGKSPFPVRESYRWAKWATYLLSYSGNTISNPLDIWAIATQFAVRERLNESVDLGFDDLNDWLTHKPFLSEAKETSYMRMVDEGLIKPLESRTSEIPAIDYPDRPTSGGMYEQALREQTERDATSLTAISKQWIANFFATLWKEKPYMLPSQQIAHIQDKTKKMGMSVVIMGEGEQSGSFNFKIPGAYPFNFTF